MHARKKQLHPKRSQTNVVISFKYIQAVVQRKGKQKPGVCEGILNWPIKRQNAKIFLKDVLFNAVMNLNAS